MHVTLFDLLSIHNTFIYYGCPMFIFVEPLIHLARTSKANVDVRSVRLSRLYSRYPSKYTIDIFIFIERNQNEIHSCRTDGTFVHVDPLRYRSSFAIESGIPKPIRTSTYTCN